MIRKISPITLISLFFSILSIISFCFLFETDGTVNFIFRVLWIVSGIPSIALPILSKWHRRKNGFSGSILEIISLVLGFFAFNFVLMYTTTINGSLISVIAVIFIVIYVKAFNSVSPSSPSSEESAISNSKQRFCKMCGGSIDSTTKKCNKCGKQYFRWKDFKRISTVFLIVLTTISLITVIAHQNSEHQKTISELNNTIASLSSSIDENNKTIKEYEIELRSKQSIISQYKKKVESLEEEISFYDVHVVFIPSDGTNTYHKYDCYLFRYSMDRFRAYNTEQAISRGFSPCKYCCGS